MRKSVTVIAIATLAAGCTAPPSASSAPAGRAEIALRSLAQAIATADTVLLIDLFAADASYDDFQGQHTYRGLEEIVGYLTSAHGWGDDIYLNLGKVHAGDGFAVGEWVFAAVQNRPMGTRVPVATGQEVVLNGVTIVELRGDLIVRGADYTDAVPLVLQLGGRVEVPGGGEWSLEGGR